MQKRFKRVDDTFDKLASKHREELENAKIKPIHDEFLYAQNGICIMIAAPGTGKTYNYLKISNQQEELFAEPFFETIVICSTSGEFDKTVQVFRSAIKKSNLIAIGDDNLLNWLEEYKQKILAYNAIMKFVNNGLKNPCDRVKEIVRGRNHPSKVVEIIGNKLKEIGWRTYPHRLLLILDDFASHPLLRRKEDKLSREIKKLRHFNINVIACVQTAKSIPKDIKRIMTDCVLFPGMSEDDFKELFKESSASKFNYKALWDDYSKITNKHTMFTIHLEAGKIITKYPMN
jgi:hypothetical protein